MIPDYRNQSLNDHQITIECTLQFRPYRAQCVIDEDLFLLMSALGEVPLKKVTDGQSSAENHKGYTQCLDV